MGDQGGDEGAELADGETSSKTDKELGETMATAETEVGEGKPGAPVKECDKIRTVYVRKVRGPARAKVGDTVKYEAYEFYIKEEGKTVGPEELCAAEKAKVKWTVIVDGKRNDREETGDTLEFEVPEKMGDVALSEKTMHVHPYMNSPAQSIKVETLVDDGKIVIVIDPGHGDKFGRWLDPGAVAKSGNKIIAMEKDMALAVANLLKAELLKLELVNEVYLTRTKDLDDKKRPRLSWRTKIAHDKGADYLISLHMDSSPKASTQGHTIYYKSGNAEGQKLAKAITAAYTLISPWKGDGTGDKGLYMTGRFKGSAGGILVEMGFISNTSDRTVISTKSATVAKQIAAGVNNYLEAALKPAEEGASQ